MSVLDLEPRYAQLEPLRVVGKNSGGNWMVECRCDCGNLRTTSATCLRQGSVFRCSECQLKKMRSGADKTFWYRIRHSARYRGHKMEVSFDHIKELFVKQEGMCAVSGRTIRWPETTADIYAPDVASLDRINSDIPYREGNVQWVTKDVNRAKSVFSMDDFVSLCQDVVAHQSTIDKDTGGD